MSLATLWRFKAEQVRRYLPELDAHADVEDRNQQIVWRFDDRSYVECDTGHGNWQVAVRVYDRTNGLAAEIEIGTAPLPSLAARLVAKGWRLLEDETPEDDLGPITDEGD